MTEIIATCTFDSWTSATAERRGDKIEDRHLIYEGAGVVLDLLLKRTGEGSRIHVGGQILPHDTHPRDVAGIAIAIECGGDRSVTHTNALGEFSFLAAPGSFGLSIVLDHRRFRVRGLESPEPRMWQVVASAPAAARNLQ